MPEVLDRLYVIACWGAIDRPTCIEAPSPVVLVIMLLLVTLVIWAFRKAVGG